MNRAMFSGVAGMKSHQTKMDVIGNNIANVNTYGYKSQRAVFSDIYYQTLREAHPAVRLAVVVPTHPWLVTVLPAGRAISDDPVQHAEHWLRYGRGDCW